MAKFRITWIHKKNGNIDKTVIDAKDFNHAARIAKSYSDERWEIKEIKKV